MSENTLCRFILFGSIFIAASGDLGICSNSEIRQIFHNQLVKHLGNGSYVTTGDLSHLYTKHLLQWSTRSTLSDCFSEEEGKTTCDENCLLVKCLSPADVYQLSGLAERAGTMETATLSMILLHTIENKACVAEHEPIAFAHAQFESSADDEHHEPVSTAQTWGYGVLCTTVIVLAALGGLLALPFVHGVNYKRMLIYMVGLAVGTLSGSSLLFLLPEALELHEVHEGDLDEHNPMWKCLVMIGAIYVFFIIERVLKMITSWRERHHHHKELHNGIQGGRFAKLKPETRYRDPRFTDMTSLPRTAPCGGNMSCDSGIDNVSDLHTDVPSNTQDESNDIPANSNAIDKDLLHVAPVAWMIIFGDALHNFVDGISIGAAFTGSVLGGVSVSVAVLCEELPHELGDFAVLLNSGMSKKRAALSNFLSACTIYIGLVVGIFLGENVEANTWVFAFAAGMFLYIALVDMMPEMCAAGELEENKKLIGTGIIFLLQNLGMLSGFGVTIILAIYGGNLQSAITSET